MSVMGVNSEHLNQLKEDCIVHNWKIKYQDNPVLKKILRIIAIFVFVIVPLLCILMTTFYPLWLKEWKFFLSATYGFIGLLTILLLFFYINCRYGAYLAWKLNDKGVFINRERQLIKWGRISSCTIRTVLELKGYYMVKLKLITGLKKSIILSDNEYPINNVAAIFKQYIGSGKITVDLKNPSSILAALPFERF